MGFCIHLVSMRLEVLLCVTLLLVGMRFVPLASCDDRVRPCRSWEVFALERRKWFPDDRAISNQGERGEG